MCLNKACPEYMALYYCPRRRLPLDRVLAFSPGPQRNYRMWLDEGLLWKREVLTANVISYQMNANTLWTKLQMRITEGSVALQRILHPSMGRLEACFTTVVGEGGIPWTSDVVPKDLQRLCIRAQRLYDF